MSKREPADKEEVARVFGNVMTTRAAIIEHAKGKRGVAASIECPICKTGTVRYSIAECNGHVWAKCSTDKCVGWIE